MNAENTTQLDTETLTQGHKKTTHDLPLLKTDLLVYVEVISDLLRN